MILRITFLSLLLASPAVLAVAQPSFDCTRSASSVEKLICEDDTLGALDQRLAERFAAALGVIDGLDTGRQDAANQLRATQRGWIKGRDDCWKSENMRACVETAYLSREAELVALWLLDKPDNVASYNCDGNPANEVTVYFFETALPALRLEYGDSIRAGWLVPAGSGSKYATPAGGSFWTKGDTALFEWEQGNLMDCAISR